MKATAVTSKEIRKFSLGLAVILAGLAGLQWWRHHPAAAEVTASLGLLSLLLGLLAPGVMRPVHTGFLKLGLVLGWLNTRILLTVLFFLVFTPVSFVMRLLGRDPLARKFDPRATTYWVPKPPESRGPERYEKMY